MGRSRVTDVRATFIGGACAVAFCAVLALGQAAPAPTPAPSTTAASANAPSGPRLQAELLKTIDASTAKAGDEVTLKTMQPLEFDGAKYPAGAIVSGHVTQVDASHLAVIFDHITVKKNSAVPLASLTACGDDAGVAGAVYRGSDLPASGGRGKRRRGPGEFKIREGVAICFVVLKLPLRMPRSAYLRCLRPLSKRAMEA